MENILEQVFPNHPLSGSKHLCSICGDRASGKHYGVYSCEGCKGFFKRTVRKDLTYTCREDKNCLVDRLQRNRCQYCRYQKCLSMGMKREAVQDERRRTKERHPNSYPTEMPPENIFKVERRADPNPVSNVEIENGTTLFQALRKQLLQMVEWAKQITHFTSLPIEDQTLLLNTGWNELQIAEFSHCSIGVKDKIVLSSGLTVCRNIAQQAGIDTLIFDRAVTEMVTKMRELKMDKTELCYLKTIILFNPEARGLKSKEVVEDLREKVYVSLDDYVRLTHPDQPGRFAKMLLRLPTMRSIGLKCLEPLFVSRVLQDIPIETFLLQMLQSSVASSYVLSEPEISTLPYSNYLEV